MTRPVAISSPRRDALARRVRRLVTVTIAYNVVEAVVALAAGTVASSTALLGFGLDSLVEVSSAAAVAWQFSARDHDRRQARERAALRVALSASPARPAEEYQDIHRPTLDNDAPTIFAGSAEFFRRVSAA